jgi:hypothetical protein
MVAAAASSSSGGSRLEGHLQIVKNVLMGSTSVSANNFFFSEVLQVILVKWLQPISSQVDWETDNVHLIALDFDT